MTTALALPVGDDDLARRLQDRMDFVESELARHVQSRTPYVTEAASHLLAAGGKRFRPLLVLLAAETGSRPDAQDVVDAACVVELTHIGSLYHDDVMDEATLRRGADSANARWDNHVAILTGDFLFAKSSELTAGLGPEAVRIQAQTFARLVEGQILETVKPAPDEDPLEHYLDVVAGKTGSLIATSARYGAIFGGATPEVQAALSSYGDIVGTAFQLSDDILDVVSDAGESGKTPGTDLREGVPTLPVLMARAPRPTRPTRASTRCSTPTSPTTACTPRPSACCASTRPSTRRAPTSSPAPPRPRRCSAPSNPAPSGPPSRTSPTSSPPAPPDAAPDYRQGAQRVASRRWAARRVSSRTPATDRPGTCEVVSVTRGSQVSGSSGAHQVQGAGREQPAVVPAGRRAGPVVDDVPGDVHVGVPRRTRVAQPDDRAAPSPRDASMLSWASRPSMVSLRGRDVGRRGSRWTTQPKRKASPGSRARSNRSSAADHPRPAPSRP